MRNLKKILALALALVMSLSLMATANAFTDDDSITDTYETAVTVLSGLKVFQGYDDGSFQPQGAITRAEVAAIIYRIVTGDVADTQVGIYADYNKFDDVASTSWYAGYVNFCANAEYIKGYDARTFGPNDPVTGYQALAMILRALGYDKNGEFTGTNWQVQTAAVGEQRGITKNITAGTLGVPATREVVAEILFRAILVPTVNYTPAFGYTIGDTSLGYKTFGLEDITGVVVANEYADLYSASPMDEGETELNVDGESYTLAYATTVEDLGEARHAYVTGETVLAIADAGNTVWTNAGAETDIGSNSKFEDVTALEKGDAEEYINFGGDGDAYESEYRIEYVLEFDTPELLTAFEEEYGVDVSDVMGAGPLNFEKSIRPGNAITEDDLTIIKAIFNDADRVNDRDYIVGEVYVGTQSTTDISDKISYRAFYNEYIDEVGDNAEVDGADNGEWLKVIDNDGDGEADYVFRVDFAMSVINRISKSGVYTLEALDNVDEVSFATTTIDSGDMVTADELAEGDVVIYTLIDGVYYVDLAETVTETIDARGINSKTETITCDGTDYVQSHIGYTDQTNYMWDVTDAHTEVTYDLYLDHFGYVRLLIESDWDSFMLLTDGWYENDNRNADYKAYYWNVDAAEETEIQLTDNDDGFIYEDAEGDEETWGNLKAAGDYYFAYNQNNDPFITNIAGYAQSDDGYSLVDAEDTTRREAYEVKELYIKPGTDVEDRVLTEKVTDDRIQTTTDTQYYLVIRDGDKLVDVLTWTGYANSVDGAVLADDAVAAYAVTHESDSNNYWIADVVVFETEDTADHDTYFVYGQNNYNREYVWGIGYNADSAIEDQRIDVEDGTDEITDNGMIQFYEIYDDTTAQIIDENYAANNIYAGTVDVIYDVTGRDYIQVADTAAGYLRFNPEEIPVYVVTGSEDAYPDPDEYGVDEIEDYDEILYDARMILFTDNDENVLYAIWVDGSVWGKNDTVYAAVEDLYDAIVFDAGLPTDIEWAIDIAETLIPLDANKWTSNDVTNAGLAIEILNATENAGYEALAEDLRLQMEAADEALTEAGELATAKADALAMLENFTAEDGKWNAWTAGMIDAVEAWIAEQTDATVLTEGEMANVAKGIQDAQNAAKTAIEAAGAAANVVKAGTITSGAEEKAHVDTLSDATAIDNYVAEVENNFAQAVVDAVVKAIGNEAAMASPTDATADNVKTVITSALNAAGFTLTDNDNEVTISVADPESSTDVGVTTRTAEVTVQYGELSAKTTVTLTQRSGN